MRVFRCKFVGMVRWLVRAYKNEITKMCQIFYFLMTIILHVRGGLAVLGR